MVNLDQFRETYLTESFELLEEMETQLVDLDESDPDSEMLNAIFRCAHSIKGGGGAFGLTELVSFTHILEALLEELRSGTLSPTQEIIDTLLASVDVTRDMLECVQENKEISTCEADILKETLSSFAQNTPATNSPSPESGSGNESNNSLKRFTIRFIPEDSIFHSGNEPLLLIKELESLGTLETAVDNSKLPHIEDIDPEKCYLSWQFELETTHSEPAIKEVFEFVEDECELVIEALDAPTSTEEEAQDKSTDQDTPTAAAQKTTANKKNDSNSKAAAQRSNQSIRVDIDKIDRLVNMAGEIVIAQAMIMRRIENLPQEENKELIHGVLNLAQHTRELQESVMAVRMQPVKSIFSRMNRLVRDLSRDLKKNIRMETSGETTEIDKTVIEQLTDPLTHMIRNAIDHGIESPEERAVTDKPSEGTLKLSAAQRAGRIIIEIQDDGRGINREKVLNKAIERGIVPEDATLSNSEIEQLIFSPGFSTAEKVTNLSGRGVGMDVVRKNIEALGGVARVNSTPGEGSHFTVSLPLTLAILDGMIVRISSEFYVLPIANIIQSLRPEAGSVKNVVGNPDVIKVRGEFIPLIYLHDIFEAPDARTSPDEGLIILVESGHERFGLVVDEMVNQQQVVVKSIEDNARAVDGISGATILGDGRVSLILDIGGLGKIASSKPNKPKIAA